jgi:hypothetical protein
MRFNDNMGIRAVFRSIFKKTDSTLRKRDSAIPVSAPLAESIQQMRIVLKQRNRLMDALIAVLVQHPSFSQFRSETTAIPAPVPRALVPILQAIGSSTHTIVKLSEVAPSFQTRDCYSIARSVLELSVNACFLMAGGPTVAERAFRHARQKAFRDLERDSRIGPSIIRAVFMGKPDPSSVPGLSEDIRQFTAKSGREKGWVDESIDDRIAAIGEHFGQGVLDLLHLARFMVYRHSSEVLHGTLFGALYFFGLTQPKQDMTLRDSAEDIGQQHIMLLGATAFCLHSVVRVFHSAYGFRWAYDLSCRLTESLSSIPYLQNSSASEDVGPKGCGTSDDT